MSVMSVHSSLGKHNIQSYGHDGGFLLFDRDTDGRSGRRILINAQLANKFSALISHDSKGLLVIAGIKQLRAKGGGINSSNSCNSKPQRHMDAIGHVLVTYEIHQSSFDDPYGGIRIIDIDLADFGRSREPGFYHVQRVNKKRWETLEDKPKKRIKTHKAAINGRVESFEVAAGDLMPTMIEKAYDSAEAEGFDFFYQPPSLLRRGLGWRTPAQKRVNSQVASQYLAKGLLEAQKKKQTIQWVIHGDGATLLAQALEQLKGHKLDQHEVLFAGIPKQKLGPVMQTMKQAGMRFHKDIIKYNPHDWNALNNRVWGMSGLYRVIESLGDEYEDRLGVLKAQAGGDRETALGLGMSAFKGGGVVAAAFYAGAEPGIALGAGSAYGVYKAYRKLKSLRNLAGNRSSRASLNPHMHPLKSGAEFEHHVVKSHGGQLNSFLALVGMSRG